ncbi:unnamed protein product [Cylicocyclus nassatus]|uniref:Uncharacterized protein n=1 Tax=Cylicocyclus nassatus TaxID=53992 RepID=A0AA36H6N2_CYLNA|nr:unnamed protein product [Cylicocyclus nassatus]
MLFNFLRKAGLCSRLRGSKKTSTSTSTTSPSTISTTPTPAYAPHSGSCCCPTVKTKILPPLKLQNLLVVIAKVVEMLCNFLKKADSCCCPHCKDQDLITTEAPKSSCCECEMQAQVEPETTQIPMPAACSCPPIEKQTTTEAPTIQYSPCDCGMSIESTPIPTEAPQASKSLL